MCVAVPSRVISIEDTIATVDVHGARRDVSLLLIEDDIKVGDYVIVHAGFVIQKLQEDYAKETLKLFNQIVEVEEESEY